MMDITAILIRKYPDTKWELNGSAYAGLNWFDESPKPTEAELLALWPEVEEEINKPPPNWEQFNAIAMADPDLNNAIAVTMPIAPLAALALPAALINAENGKLTEFAAAFNGVVQAAQVSNEVIDGWIAVATDNNLPQAFIDILQEAKS